MCEQPAKSMTTSTQSISKEEEIITNTENNEEIDTTTTKNNTHFKNSSNTTTSINISNKSLNLSLPQYLINAFGDLYKEDGLLVLGRGLGLLPLLSS